jgi:hypothetical protein
MWRLIFILVFGVAVHGQNRAVVNVGASPNDGTGDSVRAAFIKVNTNFYNLWQTVYTNGVAVRGGTNQLTQNWNLKGRTNTVGIEFDSLLSFEATANDAQLTGINSLYLDGGDTTIRGQSNLFLLTPEATNFTVASNAVLTLIDPATGRAEYRPILEVQSAASSTLLQELDRRVGSVDNVAALIAKDPSADMLVATRGYHAPGDGGHGLYRWTNALPSGVVTNRGTWFAGSSGFWSLVHDGVYNVKQFGAKGDSKANNTTIYVVGNDDTSAIQEVIDTAIIDGGGEVRIPKGTYRVTSELLVQRRDDTFARLGLVNPDTNSIPYWNDRVIIRISGDSYSSFIVANGTNGILTVTGKPNYDSYANRVQNVVIEDLSIHHMNNAVSCHVVSIYNAGFIAMNRVRSRGGFISLKLSAVSEIQVNKCDFHNSNYGVWMERGLGSTAGDMAGVTLLDCQAFDQSRACIAAHYFRDIHIVGGFYGGRDLTVAAVWLSGLSPAVNGNLWIQDVSMESDPVDLVPIVLVGTDGTEGGGTVFSPLIYPLNTWTNTQVSMRGLEINSCNLSFAPTNGAIRIRGANTAMSKGLVVNGSWFETFTANPAIVIESTAPPSVIVRYGDGNFPVDLIARTRDERPFFLTSSVDVNAGNLLNAGWRDMGKGGNVWIGANSPTTVITNLVGPFGVELLGGAQRDTFMPLYSGQSPITINSNNVIVMDWAVLWPTTVFESAPATAIRLYDTLNGVFYQHFNLGQWVEHARYTNSYGVWRRYVASVRPPAGATIDRIAFNNFADTNTTVTLGYLALYSKDYSGDGSSISGANAAIWSGRYNAGDVQITSGTPQGGNWFARKWTGGWAVREAFNPATIYNRGNSITSGTNVYLATISGITGGAAPTHTSGIVDDWAFVATGSAATEQRVVSQTVGGTLTTTRLVATVGNFGGGVADASAALDVASTTQGFLPPRLTEAQRDLIPSPSPGLIIFNLTADKLQVRSSASWENLH